MATIEKFEDLKAWQEARRLARDLYALSGKGEFARDYALRDQARRAAISVLSNIAEGFERGGNSELVQFLSIAKGSAAEIRAQLCIACDCGYINSKQFAELHATAKDVGGKLGALIAYLRNSGMKGTKFKP
ncbi:MAG: four helix bundle protein [Betaproteobacteria bacterium RIFCSPLOWO2_12_FULL_62_58]|nr:MAG: four helix bundle protein [Betaproteobacteria bacterium RIFCSPLOWO2_12_FULL_62_58]